MFFPIIIQNILKTHVKTKNHGKKTCWWEEKNGLQQKQEDSIRNLQQELCKKEDRINVLTQKNLIKKTKHLSGYYRRKR